MQQYMRRVLEAGQRNARAEQAPSQPPSTPTPAAGVAAKPSARNASAKDDGAAPDDADENGGAKAPRTQPQPQPQPEPVQSIAAVVDAFAAATVTGGTLMVHEWSQATSGARPGQKRVGIYSGENQFETAHENAQFLMKLALQAALGAPIEGNWTLVSDELTEWRDTAGVATSAFKSLDTDNGHNWNALDNLIHALCVLMQTSVVVADGLVNERDAPASRFVATDAWRGARDGYGLLQSAPSAPSEVPAFEPGSRLDAYNELKSMNMQDELTMNHVPYVWLGLFLQYRISVPDVDRGFSENVRKLLASVGEHFLTSYASAEFAPEYELPPERGFTYDSHVTGKFQRMPKVKHGFQWPVYSEAAWNFAFAQSSQTTSDDMHDDLALTQSFIDDYNHKDASVFDPEQHVTIVYEVSAEDGVESGDDDMDSD